MKITTKQGVRIKLTEEGIDIIADERDWKSLLRFDVYIRGLSLKLTKEDKVKLKELLTIEHEQETK